MRVILQVTAGPSSGRQIPLQVGEIARVGRGDAADVCIAGDDGMSAVHFQLECQPSGPRVLDLQSVGGTLLNGQPLSEAAVCNGDEIAAGNSRMVIHIEGAPVGPPATSEAPAEQRDQTHSTSQTAAEICQSLDLEDESRALLTPELSPQAYVARLVEGRKLADAMRVLAACLPKRDAITWALQAVQQILADSLNPEAKRSLDATTAWLDDPSEENRRATMLAAEEAEFISPACWVAAAAFWSEGSIAPPDLPDVPPDPQLTGQGVYAALIMTATGGDVTKADDRFEAIIKLGQQIQQAGQAVTA